MGPAGEIPQPPHFEWLDLSAKRRHVSVWLQESNWLRGLEGEMDPSHVSFLHSSEQRSVSAHRIISITERSPEVFVRNTPYGIMCIARRDAGEQGYYWRISKWLAPSYSMIPSAAGLLNGRMWVPIDDSHSYCWHYAYRLDRDISDAELAQLESGLGFPPQSVLQRFALNNGDCIDTWVPVRNRRNGYLEIARCSRPEISRVSRVQMIRTVPYRKKSNAPVREYSSISSTPTKPSLLFESI